MAHQKSELDNITLPSGRNVRQFRIDSKRHKKEYSSTLAASLKHVLRQNGEYSSWQEFIARAKSLFSTFSGGSSALNVAPQTLLLSGAQSNIDNVVMNHWLTSLIHESETVDIVIDVRGDTLKYPTIRSALSKNLPSRKFRLLNMTTKNEDDKLSYMYTNTFKRDPEQLETLLAASKCAMGRCPDGAASSEEKIEYLSQPGGYNAFSLLEREEGEGFSVSEMFSPSSTTAIIFPALVQSSKIVEDALFDMLYLIKQNQSTSNSPVRITLSGIPRGVNIPQDLVEWLFNSDNVQAIVHCYYPSLQQNNWINYAIEHSSQSFLSFAEHTQDIPIAVKSLTSMLMQMKRNNNNKALPALKLEKGSLVSSFMLLGLTPMPLDKNLTHPLHRNGDTLKK
jgi:hypothetical protein